MRPAAELPDGGTRRRGFFGVARLLAAATLLTVAARALPPLEQLRHAPVTPFDRSAPAMAPVYAFIRRAAAWIPPGATVTVRSEPRDPFRETILHRYAVALLPGCRVLPAALWNVPAPEIEARAQYVIVIGTPHSPPRSELVLDNPFGSIWRAPSQ